jgi:hypothetical protein
MGYYYGFEYPNGYTMRIARNAYSSLSMEEK